jgi:hypothetical protein
MDTADVFHFLLGDCVPLSLTREDTSKTGMANVNQREMKIGLQNDRYGGAHVVIPRTSNVLSFQFSWEFYQGESEREMIN